MKEIEIDEKEINIWISDIENCISCFRAKPILRKELKKLVEFLNYIKELKGIKNTELSKKEKDERMLK